MKIYIDLLLWDEVDDYDTESLKAKFQEVAKRFTGLGCLKFEIRGAGAQQPQMSPEQIQAYQAYQQQAYQEQEAQRQYQEQLQQQEIQRQEQLQRQQQVQQRSPPQVQQRPPQQQPQRPSQPQRQQVEEEVVDE